MAQPTPFEIVEHGGVRVASNGVASLSLLDAGGLLFRRRGVRGLQTAPAAEVLIPQLNQLAGELLANPETTAAEAVARVMAIAGTVRFAEPEHSEWAVAELDGVRVYHDGSNVIVTREDLTP